MTISPGVLWNFFSRPSYSVISVIQSFPGPSSVVQHFIEPMVHDPSRFSPSVFCLLSFVRLSVVVLWSTTLHFFVSLTFDSGLIVFSFVLIYSLPPSGPSLSVFVSVSHFLFVLSLSRPSPSFSL